MKFDPVLFSKAMADETRQKIMQMLCCNWLSVNEVVAKLDAFETAEVSGNTHRVLLGCGLTTVHARQDSSFTCGLSTSGDRGRLRPSCDACPFSLDQLLPRRGRRMGDSLTRFIAPAPSPTPSSENREAAGPTAFWGSAPFSSFGCQ